MENKNAFVKRPFALIGLSFFLTVWSLAMFQMKFVVVLLPILFSAVALTMIIKHKMQATVLVMLFITVSSACLCFYLFERSYSDIKLYSGNDKTVVGTVLEMKEYYSGTRCVIESEKIDNENVKTKLNIYSNNINKEEFSQFDKISFHTDLECFKSSDKQYENYNKSQGIFLSGTVNDKAINVISTDNTSLSYRIYRIRQAICDGVRSFLPNDNGELILSFFLGERDGLSDKAVADFKICGITHLMAVSGLHMTIWTGIVFSFFVLFISRRKAAVFSIAFTVFFMALTGFSPSVVRAGTMMITVYFGYMILKPADSINSLGIALTALCLNNPYSSCDAGMLLSFSAALGLCLFRDKINSKEITVFVKEYKNKLLLSLYRTVMITLTASVFTLPVSVFIFGEISLLSVIGNIACVEISMFIMVLGGIGAIFTAVGFTRFLGQPILIVAALLSKLLLKTVALIAEADFMYINVESEYVRVCVVMLVAANLLIYIFKPDIYKNKKLTSFIMANIVVLGILSKFIVTKMIGVI